MKTFEFYPEDIQTFIKRGCPYKIGDKVLYKATYISDLDSLKLVYNGVVKDIYPHFRKELIPQFETSNLYEVKINEEEASKPIPKFTLYIECQVPDKKPWYKPFKKRTYHTKSMCVTIDSFGFICDHGLGFKELTKI